jgi:hypothetical protein
MDFKVDIAGYVHDCYFTKLSSNDMLNVIVNVKN